MLQGTSSGIKPFPPPRVFPRETVDGPTDERLACALSGSEYLAMKGSEQPTPQNNRDKSQNSSAARSQTERDGLAYGAVRIKFQETQANLNGQKTDRDVETGDGRTGAQEARGKS